MTRRRSSSATDLHSDSPLSVYYAPPSSFFSDSPTTIFTAELLEEDTEPASNGTLPPHPIENQPSINEPRTRLTLHRILSIAIPITFAVPKVVQALQGKTSALTLGHLDLFLVLLQAILTACSWWESNPPQRLRWLLDTDWLYLFDTSNQWTASQHRLPVATPSNTIPSASHSLTNALANNQIPSGGQRKKPEMYQCNQCMKVFPRPSGLVMHMNSHSGAKPYKCIVPNCDKSFAVRSNAERHLRSHGIKPSSPDTTTIPHYAVRFEAPHDGEWGYQGSSSSAFVFRVPLA